MRNYITCYDPFFDEFFLNERKSSKALMNTDIKEYKDHIELYIDVPSVKKEDLKVSIKDGNLTVKAVFNNAENAEKADYSYTERARGEYSRTFFIGKGITLGDINAKLDNGVLILNINKVNEKINEEQYVQIA